MALFGLPGSIDLRIAEREPVNKYYQKAEEGGWKGATDSPQLGLWSLFSRAKYIAAKKGPREPGERPDDLRCASELFFAALELTWRAGYRSEALAADFLKMIRAMK